jgi:rubrerythrin
MAEYSYEQLKKKKVDDLRAIAKELEHEAVKGYTQLRKDELLAALCTALGIEAHGHRRATGIDKKAVKGRIRELKAERDAAIAAKDSEKLHRVRRRIHRLRHKLRRAAV